MQAMTRRKGTTAAFTLAEVRKGMYPGPVYEGHFSDGGMLRMSFWSRSGKPLDVAAGRRVVTKCYRGNWSRAKPWAPSMDAPTLVAGYVVLKNTQFVELTREPDDMSRRRPRRGSRHCRHGAR